MTKGPPKHAQNKHRSPYEVFAWMSRTGSPVFGVIQNPSKKTRAPRVAGTPIGNGRVFPQNLELGNWKLPYINSLKDRRLILRTPHKKNALYSAKVQFAVFVKDVHRLWRSLTAVLGNHDCFLFEKIYSLWEHLF